MPEPTSFIDVLQASSKINYQWNVKSDQMRCKSEKASAHFASDYHFCSNEYHHLLKARDFERRVCALKAAVVSSDGRYTCVYPIHLSPLTHTLIQEEGRLDYTLNSGMNFRGVLKKVNPLAYHKLLGSHFTNLSGYDQVTGLPERDLIYENLALYSSQSALNHINTLCMMVTLKHIMDMAFHASIKDFNHLMQQTVRHIQQQTHPCDFIGRLSATTFVLIFNHCDRTFEDISNKLQACLNDLDMHHSLGEIDFEITGSYITQSMHQDHIARSIGQMEQSLFTSLQAQNLDQKRAVGSV